MSILVPVLLTFLALTAWQGHGASLVQTSRILKESINLLSNLLKMKVSCDKMNVTNIFAGDKKDDDMELLCKAATVTGQGRSCHMYLDGISINLRHLVQKKKTDTKVLCPVPEGTPTALSNFLLDLQRVLQRLAKQQSLK